MRLSRSQLKGVSDVAPCQDSGNLQYGAYQTRARFRVPGRRSFRKNQRTISHGIATHGQYEILIQDREDRQGIEVKGEADHVCELLIHMQESLLDAIIVSLLPTDDSEPLVVANLELPGGAKEKLDRVRSSVVPTLKNHHRLKIINPDLLESAEIEFSRHPEDGNGPGKEASQGSDFGPFDQRRHESGLST